MHVEVPRSITLTIPTRLDCIELIGESLRALCPLAGLSEAESYRIELGVVEALNNVVEHAYSFQPDGQVSLQLTFEPDCLRFVIRDTGAPRPSGLSSDPVDPRAFDASDRSAWPEGGMGLFIMSEVMDSVSYERGDGENRLTLTRNLV